MDDPPGPAGRWVIGPLKQCSGDTSQNRRYLFAPSLNDLFGGVLIFNGVYVWAIDTNMGATRRVGCQS
ncbi:hypothetical protein [Rhizobium fabae]|uniref:Uncharacterized protein n=1 Tax=Rhizobium fabae TaxID=573179 RepID=A0A7W6FL65_9HYPH|nr:hypothetical protein [Rhizobium fabae]